MVITKKDGATPTAEEARNIKALVTKSIVESVMTSGEPAVYIKGWKPIPLALLLEARDGESRD